MITFNCSICKKEITGIAIVLDKEHIVHHECRNEIERKNNWDDTQLLKDIIDHEKEQHVEWMSKL